MIIRCWGARGSIAVSGKDCVKYGGDTACLEIRTKNDEIIIVDAGTGIRRLGNRLLREGRTTFHMLLTHFHWDHLMGFPFFKPLYDKKSRIIIYGRPLPEHSIEDILTDIMKDPIFPVNYRIVAPHIEYDQQHRSGFTIDSVMVTPIMLSHPNQGMGYIFSEEGKRFVFLTDNELTYVHPGGLNYGEYRAACEGADLLIHDAEFTPDEYEQTRRWGHSVYTDVLTLAMEAPVKALGLFHHNQDRSDEAMDRIIEDCRSIIGRNKVTMDCFALTQDTEIVL